MKLAILGMGLMGTAMAKAALHVGHEVIVYNRTVAKTDPLSDLGAKVASTAADAIIAADATILVLLDGKALSDVLLLPETLNAVKGKKIMNASTSTAAEIAEVNRLVLASGGDFAIMNINSGAEKLRAGKSDITFGCKIEDDSFWTHLLTGFSASAVRIGDVINAARVEETRLLISMSHMITTAYGVALAQKYGIAPEIYQSVLLSKPESMDDIVSKMISHDYDDVYAALYSYVTGLKAVVSGLKSQQIPTGIYDTMLSLFIEAEKRGDAQKDGAAVLEIILHP